MNVPYNNGKVQIGKYYQKPAYVEDDPDMIQIQGWLIGDNKQAKINFYGKVSYYCLVILAVILGIIYA